jgi:phosphoribosylformylglycinamidine cyclo-ligase
MADGAYARAGVDLARTGRALGALVDVLRGIDPGRPSATALGSGHYATVLRLDDRRGLALATDGVGTKLIVAEQLERYDTIGIDCVAMNANDIVCVGAEPIALLDYVAVEEADADTLAAVARGLRRGAEEAGVEVPGGELAIVPELLQGHPSPRGLDLVGFCLGLVELDAIVTGEGAEPGDAILGLPSNGIHSNGLTLARRVLSDLSEAPAELDGGTVGDELLRPTAIYVRAIRELLDSDIDVRGLAHVTGDGFLNLLRLEAAVGWRIDAPLPVPPVFGLIADRGQVEDADMYEVFNMGCGFCCVVPWNQAEEAVELLSTRHPGTAVIGQATTAEGLVELPRAASGRGLIGRRGEGFRTAA